MSPTGLHDWIDPRHLTPHAVAAHRARFAADRFASLVVDDFLTARGLDGLRRCFGGDGRFDAYHGLAPDGEGEAAVDARAFDAAPDAHRLAREALMSGPAPGRAASPGWTAHRDFTALLTSAAFAGFLTALTGVGGLDTMTYMPRIMRHGDFCREHSDAAAGRRLCLLLYLDDGWRPGFGGRFVHVEGGAAARTVDPLGNRALLHLPRADLRHRVEAFTAAAGEWQRWTYSIWFSAAA